MVKSAENSVSVRGRNAFIGRMIRWICLACVCLAGAQLGGCATYDQPFVGEVVKVPAFYENLSRREAAFRIYRTVKAEGWPAKTCEPFAFALLDAMHAEGFEAHIARGKSGRGFEHVAVVVRVGRYWITMDADQAVNALYHAFQPEMVRIGDEWRRFSATPGVASAPSDAGR